MTIHEPMTFLTDLVLAGVSTAWGLLLVRGARTQARRFWGWGMAVSGAGALAGGTWHAIAPEIAPLPAFVLWKATMLLIGAAAWLLATGVALAVLPRAAVRWFAAVAVVQYAVYAVLATGTDSFSLVIAEYGVALVAVTVLAATGWRADRARSAWILAAVGVSVLAAAIQAAGIAPHPRFNNNDLYHLVQVAGMWCFYRGGRLA